LGRYRPPATDNRLIVPGEYEHVALESGNVTLMREAHATPCTRDEARAILAALAAKHGLPDLRIRFGSSKFGRGGRRALYRRLTVPVKRYRLVQLEAGPSYETYDDFQCRKEWVEDTQGRLVRVPWVSLPKVPMELGGDWFGRLRVGLVLHEFAHAMVPEPGHDRDFTARFDKLLADWASDLPEEPRWRSPATEQSSCEPCTPPEPREKVLRDMGKRGNCDRRPTQLSDAGRGGLRLASATRRL